MLTRLIDLYRYHQEDGEIEGTYFEINFRFLCYLMGGIILFKILSGMIRKVLILRTKLFNFRNIE